MSHTGERIRRFSARHVINHWVMIITFTGLVLTGLPQKFPAQAWAKGVVLIVGSVERVRFLHHWLGTIMALQLTWHVIELLWLHVVRRIPLTMMPRWKDVQDFFGQVMFNLGRRPEPPRMGRYTFAEKLEYLALVWGTAVMVATGLILLYPVAFSTLVPGEAVLAAKAAHGGEAILAFLSILTWHAYFVHVRHWNRSMFNGHLEEEAYAEEHALELEAIRRGDVPRPAPLTAGRMAVFAVLALLTVAAAVAVYMWMLASTPAVVTVTPPRLG